MEIDRSCVYHEVVPTVVGVAIPLLGEEHLSDDLPRGKRRNVYGFQTPEAANRKIDQSNKPLRFVGSFARCRETRAEIRILFSRGIPAWISGRSKPYCCCPGGPL
jgi:hypothetical protein